VLPGGGGGPGAVPGSPVIRDIESSAVAGTRGERIELMWCRKWTQGRRDEMLPKVFFEKLEMMLPKVAVACMSRDASEYPSVFLDFSFYFIFSSKLIT